MATMAKIRLAALAAALCVNTALIDPVTAKPNENRDSLAALVALTAEGSVEATHLMAHLAAGGDAEAMFQMAGISENYRVSKRWLQLAAENGHFHSRCELARHDRLELGIVQVRILHPASAEAGQDESDHPASWAELDNFSAMSEQHLCDVIRYMRLVNGLDNFPTPNDKLPGYMGSG
ncbi:MAG: hypothetical protein OXK82_02740 [Deltaproteobacteria bacterium]|nr:hypothetical protein [Deltaproteobacteria bacterium]